VRAVALLAARATAEAAERRRLFADLVLDETAHGAAVARTTPSLLGAGTRARQLRLLARVGDLAQAARPLSVAWAQRAIATRPDFRATLCATDIPAVVVIGDEDELVSLHEARETADSLPHGRLVTLPGVGQLAPLEAPRATADALADLLARANSREAKPC
jgi:pimeloyl-ACP methyl ester carboxylesterase